MLLLAVHFAHTDMSRPKIGKKMKLPGIVFCLYRRAHRMISHDVNGNQSEQRRLLDEMLWDWLVFPLWKTGLEKASGPSEISMEMKIKQL